MALYLLVIFSMCNKDQRFVSYLKKEKNVGNMIQRKRTYVPNHFQLSKKESLPIFFKLKQRRNTVPI